MAFRASESADENFERAVRMMVPPGMTGATRKVVIDKLHDLVDRLGPVVSGYPTWHPLVPQKDRTQPITTPCEMSGWDGLDHTVFFVNGFLTCPYDGAKGKTRVEQSASKVQTPHCASLSVEILSEPFYGDGTTPVLVVCDWDVYLEAGRMIPKSRAVPLMMEQELPGWHISDLAETWDTMRPYILGDPHGARSSLFVSQETGLTMKKIFEMMTDTGMFGSIRG